MASASILPAFTRPSPAGGARSAATCTRAGTETARSCVSTRYTPANVRCMSRTSMSLSHESDPNPDIPHRRGASFRAGGTILLHAPALRGADALPPSGKRPAADAGRDRGRLRPTRRMAGRRRRGHVRRRLCRHVYERASRTYALPYSSDHVRRVRPDRGKQRLDVDPWISEATTDVGVPAAGDERRRRRDRETYLHASPPD